MERFKVYRIREAAAGVAANFETASLEELDPGDVVIRVAYSSINYKDALAATGKGKIVRRFPCIGGIDLAGVVVSSTDPGYRKGDEVLVTSFGLGVTHDGGYAEVARVPADWVVPLPPGMTLFEAMAHGTAGYTAALAVVRMESVGLKPENGPVVVTGATGGVGSIGIGILAKLGYDVHALTSKTTEADYLKSIGAREVILRSSIDFSKVRPLESATWAGAIDNVGGETLAWLLATMKQAGAIGSVGLAQSAELKTTVMPLILRGVSLLGVDSGFTPMPLRREIWSRLAGDMRPEKLQSIVTKIPFATLPDAFGQFIEGKVKGRIVVQMRED